jgi:hypothetical protein
MPRNDFRRDRDYDNTGDYGWRDHDQDFERSSRYMRDSQNRDMDYGPSSGSEYTYDRGFDRQRRRGAWRRGSYERDYPSDYGRSSWSYGNQYNREDEGGYGRGTRSMMRGGRSGGDYDQSYGGNWGNQRARGRDQQYQGDWNRNYNAAGTGRNTTGGDFDRERDYGRAGRSGGYNYDYERGAGMSDWEYGGGTDFQYGYSGGRNRMMQRTGEQGYWNTGEWSQRPRGRFSGRGPQGYTRSDERITEDVNERLTQHQDIDAWNINVRVENGEVTLEGHVEDRWQKRMAEDVAEEVSGVKQVHNRLRVEQQQNEGISNFGTRQGDMQQGSTMMSGQQGQGEQQTQNRQSGQPSQTGRTEGSSQGRSSSRTKQTT